MTQLTREDVIEEVKPYRDMLNRNMVRNVARAELARKMVSDIQEVKERCEKRIVIRSGKKDYFDAYVTLIGYLESRQTFFKVTSDEVLGSEDSDGKEEKEQ